jgi:hypothetical protein
MIITVMGKTGQVIRPPETLEEDGPLIFLAGPIQGTHDWQARAIRLLCAKAPGVNIASPRRPRTGPDFVYAEQVDWETCQLARAGKDGVILFWLAKEQEHDAKRAYAQTSRVEIGEWMSAAARGEAKLVVGIEEGFTGGRYIRHRLAQMCPQVPVASDLEAACEAALRLLGSLA